MFKKFITLGVLLIMVFSGAGCISGSGFSEYKNSAKEKLEIFAADKGQEFYSAENWTAVMSFVAEGKVAIDAAKDKAGVDSALNATQIKIVGVEPNNFGAYFISDIGWETYIRWVAEYKELDEVWIRNALNGDFGEYAPPNIMYRNMMWAAIRGNLITISNSSSQYGIQVIQFSRDGDSYAGGKLHFAMSFTLSSEFLTVDYHTGMFKGLSIQYELDISYQGSEVEPTQLAPPKNVESHPTGQRWDYIGAAGLLGAGAEIRRAGAQDFELVQTTDVYMNNFAISCPSSYFSEGVNTVRIFHIGGPYLSYDRTTDSKQVRISLNSEYVYFNYIKNTESTITVEKVNQ